MPKKKAKKKQPAKRKKKTATKKAKSKAKPTRKKRHTTKQKSALLAKFHGLIQAGDTAQKAAKKVGVTYVTLYNWEKQSGKKRPAGKKAVRVALKKAVGGVPKKRGRKPGTAAKGGGLTLVTPSGYRIEGISTKELIKVLRELK